GTVPSDGNRVVASLTTPVAGAVGFTKVAPPTIANHRVVGAITVVAPQASPAAPLQLSMSIDVSTVPASVPLASLVVLRDGVAVPVCRAPTPTSVAAPDPCITSRSRSGNVVHVSIRTSRGSTWSLTRPLVDRVSAGTDTTIDTPIATARATYLPR